MKNLSMTRMAFTIFLGFALVLASTACTEKVLAPVVEEKIELPPFRYPVENIAVGYSYFQDVNFYAPVGVAPQIEYQVVEDRDTPANLEVSYQLGMVPDQTCEPNCSRTAWRLVVIYKPKQAGEAIVTLWETSNPREKISFRVIASVWDGTKG